MEYSRTKLIRDLIDIQYERNDTDFERGTFRVRGDVIEIIPAGENQKALRVELFGDEIERISVIEAVSGHALATLEHAALFPATHYATDPAHMEEHIGEIEQDLQKRIEEFEADGRLLEAQRIAQRTRYDIEMMREIGYCQGIENYSRYFDGRKPGDAPYTLLDYFPGDFLVIIDESHVTVPQIRAMYNGDRARKNTLVQYGFRLPSAYDNRPLLFEEFEKRIGQTIFVSATPGPYERERAQQVVEQIIRPTGLLDPQVILRPATGQVDDLVGEIRAVTARGERILVTTLTKRMAESLTEYLKDLDIRVRYLHSDIQTMERMELLRDLRLGEYDVLVGINLLREGLDLPEVALVAILDADKEGFLRSETSLVQTIGRAARNVDGRVILYGNQLTESMAKAMSETNRRRALQEEYNRLNGITPETVRNAIRSVIEITRRVEETAPAALTEEERAALMRQIEDEMITAAKDLEFERAAKLRDRLLELRGEAPMKDDHQNRRHRRRERTRKSEH
jgi:excinuclease ABC subunit B